MSQEKKKKATPSDKIDRPVSAVPHDDAVVAPAPEMHSPLVPILAIVIPMILLVAYAMFLD